MNCNDLYEGKYKNGNPTYYVDKGCTIPFTGHLEEYFKGKLSRECDIVNGIMEGIEKIYYDFEGCLEMYHEVNENRNNGLSIEYYRNGQIMNIATAIDEYYRFLQLYRTRQAAGDMDIGRRGTMAASLLLLYGRWQSKRNLEKSRCWIDSNELCGKQRENRADKETMSIRKKE